jgi:formate dehydrogenase subunit gamma
MAYAEQGGDVLTGKATSGQSAVTAEATLLESLPPEERLILPCLQHIQRGLGYISDSAVNVVAEFLNVSRAEVIGVLTYYHDLRRTPPPAVVVGVCVAEACQAAGVRSLIEHIEHDFGVTLGAGTGSGPVEFAKAYCLGNCALGPAVMVNGRLVGRCDIARVRAAVVNAQVVPR